MPIVYECQRCAACCRWPGEVRLTNEEITQIAAFTRVIEREFINRFTRLAANRHGLALEERVNGECVFLDGHACAIQAVKPQQCRDFPNLWRNPGSEATCRVIPHLVASANDAFEG